jgi:hypothetical protein
MRLIIGGISGSSPKVDTALLKAIARARRWFDDLLSGRGSFDGRNWASANGSATATSVA